MTTVWTRLSRVPCTSIRSQRVKRTRTSTAVETTRQSSGEPVNPSVFRPILLIATLMVTVSSPAQQISCPNVLPETVQSAKSVPDGWLARNSNLKHVLNGVQINFGDPQNASDGAIYDTRKLQLEANGVELETLIWG